MSRSPTSATATLKVWRRRATRERTTCRLSFRDSLSGTWRRIRSVPITIGGTLAEGSAAPSHPGSIGAISPRGTRGPGPPRTAAPARLPASKVLEQLLAQLLEALEVADRWPGRRLSRELEVLHGLDEHGDLVFAQADRAQVVRRRRGNRMGWHLDGKRLRVLLLVGCAEELVGAAQLGAAEARHHGLPAGADTAVAPAAASSAACA